MRRLILKLFRRRSLDRDLDAELAFHREMAAQHRDVIPLGNTAVIREQAFDLWRFNFFENLWRDLVYGLRGLRRSPALVFSALLSLGLGIGVNTAIFSLGVEFLFSEPSVRDASSLVSIMLAGNSNSPEKAIDFLRASGIFQDVVGEDIESFTNYNDGSETHRTFSTFTTQNYFTALGVPMLHGRGFIPSDRREAVVLDNRFWRKYFNSDPSAVGRVVNLDGRPCTIVGVLPEHHRGLLGFGLYSDIYLPKWRDDTNLMVYARLKPGVSLAQARAALLIVAKRMETEMPSRFWQWSRGLRIAPVSGIARIGSQTEILTIVVFFAMLLAIVGLVLLIACVNVANLLLARASARKSEIAIRLALGAGRGRLLQQLLVESLLLSMAGAALGFVLAEITAGALARIQLPLPVPIQLQITPDWRVAGYAAVLTIFAALASGLLPAWRSVKESLAPDLHRDTRLRLRRALVTAQMAISVIVLATGFLFLRNLVDANAISPGFDVRHTLRADVNLPPTQYTSLQRKQQYIGRAIRELAAIPGIESVAAAQVVPFTDNYHMGTDIQFPDNGQKVSTRFQWNAVTEAFFQAMDIPIRVGRTFSPADHGEKVAIVNQTFVKRYLGNRRPLGTVFLWGREGKTPYRIVGVVEGTKTMTIGEEPQAQLYEPLDQINNDRLRIQFVMRSSIPPALQLDAVRRVMHGIEPMAGAQIETMFASIGLAFLPSQVGAVLLGSTGVLGLLLAAIGLYGVMVYAVTRRTREIGVRMAIGATRSDISGLVLREVAQLTLAGSLIGVFIAQFITRPLAIFLVPGLKPTDPLSFGAVILVMIATGIAAACGPVRRAVMVDPNVALRQE